MGYIGFLFGINFGVAVNKAVNKSEKKLASKYSNEQKTEIINKAYSNATIEFINEGTINCEGGFEITAEASSSAETMAVIQKEENLEFTNDVFDELLNEVESEVEQKNEGGMFDANAAISVNKTLNENKTAIEQIIEKSIETLIDTSTEAEGTVLFKNTGTMTSSSKCIFGADAAAIAVSNLISDETTDLLQSNELSLKMENQAKIALTQTNEFSLGMMLLIIAFIAVPILGGGGTAAGGSIWGAIIFLLCGIGFAVALFFINTKVCNNDNNDEPTEKEDCDKDTDENNCLECKDGSEIVSKPFSNWWWIGCLIACIVCILISIVLFIVYFKSARAGKLKKASNIPSTVSYPEDSVMKGGRILKQFLNDLFK